MDPDLAKVLPSLSLVDLSDVPAAREASAQRFAAAGAPPASWRASFVDRTIPSARNEDGVRVRVYQPEGRSGSPLGCAVFFHGGGYILGDLETDHDRCLCYSSEAGCVVVSVDYRLAPEHRYPRGLDDCYAAVEWAASAGDELGVDAGRLAVAGSSAGGGLAAASAIRARDEGGPAVAFQLLVQPALDDRLESVSMAQFVGVPPWDATASRQMWDIYLGVGREERTDVPATAAPSRAADLSGLPPAYVMTAELDPLRDEGAAYALRLSAAGVPTELHQFPAAFHGFDRPALGAAVGRRAIDDQVQALRRALAAG